MLNMKPHRIPPQVFFALCDAAGLKSVDIARKLDVTRAAVSQWRSGVHNMDDQNYRRLEALALTSESRILALYRAAHHPEGVGSPEDGTLLLTQDRAEDYRHWFIEGAEFNQEHSEDQENRHKQNKKQIPKRLLLLLVEAAEVNAAGEQGLVLAEPLSNFSHCAAEVTPFKPSSNTNKLPEVFPAQFNLARLFKDIRHL